MSNNLISKSEYITESGEKISLNFGIIRSVIAVGENFTDAEIYEFMKLCEYRKLNPFTKEAYLIKFGKNKAAQIVVGKDVFTNRLNSHPDCQGWQAGIIVEDKKTNQIKERKGSFMLKNKENLVGAWITIRRKSWKEPFFWSISLDEFLRIYYDKNTNSYQPMGQWASMPCIMLVKCAIVSGARNAFPKDFGGMYSPEETGVEISNIIDVDDIKEVKEVEEIENVNKKEKMITEKQVKYLFANCKSNENEIEIDQNKLLKFALKELVNRKKLNPNVLDSKKNIPASKVDMIIDFIKFLVKKKEIEFYKEEKEKKEETIVEMNYEIEKENENKNENKENKNVKEN
jgi:phage recombination protein Bet